MTKLSPLEAIDAITRALDWLSLSYWHYVSDNVLAVDGGGYITLPDDPDARRFSLWGRIALEAGFHTLDHDLGDRVPAAYALAEKTMLAANVSPKDVRVLIDQEAPFDYIRNAIEDKFRVAKLLAGGEA